MRIIKCDKCGISDSKDSRVEMIMVGGEWLDICFNCLGLYKVWIDSRKAMLAQQFEQQFEKEKIDWVKGGTQ